MKAKMKGSMRRVDGSERGRSDEDGGQPGNGTKQWTRHVSEWHVLTLSRVVAYCTSGTATTTKNKDPYTYSSCLSVVLNDF